MQFDTAVILSWVVFGIGLSAVAGIYDLHRQTKSWSLARRLSAIILISAILLPSISDADEIASFAYLSGRSRSVGQNSSILSESSQEDSEEQFAGFWEFAEHRNLVDLWSQSPEVVLWFVSFSAIRRGRSFEFAATAPGRAPPVLPAV